MSLMIDGFAYEPRQYKKFFGYYSVLKRASEDFRGGVRFIVKSPKYLYINQGEYCIIHKDDENIDIVGSDDATTCCLLFLKLDDWYLVAHLDDTLKEETFKEMINKFLLSDESRPSTSAPRITCKLVGSYNDPKQISCRLLKKLYGFLNNLTNVIIELKIACVLQVNTEIIEVTYGGETKYCPSPIQYGAAFILNSTEKDFTIFNLFPAKFQNKREPNLILRKARKSSEFKDLTQVYHSRNKIFVINTFKYFKYSDLDLVSCSDKDILDLFSTSPEVEPPEFAPLLRETLALIKARDNLIEPKHEYSRGPDGEWVHV